MSALMRSADVSMRAGYEQITQTKKIQNPLQSFVVSIFKTQGPWTKFSFLLQLNNELLNEHFLKGLIHFKLTKHNSPQSKQIREM